MKQTNKNHETILVLGGTGKTGSRVAHRLTELGYTVRLGSRKSELPFDWENAATWEPVLQNIDSVYITFQPDLALPGADEMIAAFSKLAVDNGVKKLVLLSGRGEPEARRCENMVMEAGADWTIVRASWFMQNFNESHLLEPILAGYVSLPVGDVGEPFIDADDIADVAVAALTQRGHSGKVYEVTGPRLITFREAVAEIAAASGRNIHYEQISLDKYTAMLEAYGVPEVVTSLLTYLFTEVLDGRNAMLMDGVQQALGRTPVDFSTFVHKYAEQGLWQPARALTI